MSNRKFIVDQGQVESIIKLLAASTLPFESESSTHASIYSLGDDALANCYFVIVSICHQTSPIGEQRMRGLIKNIEKVGWDYLKEKYLLMADKDGKWADPDYWRVLRPEELSKLFEDVKYGKTLNRINERTFLINDLGNTLKSNGHSNINQLFQQCNSFIGGDSGFLARLKGFEAYSDPVMKKSQFFLAIAKTELGWNISDEEYLRSPVDYHELRGHLRVGTIIINDAGLSNKIKIGLPITNEEDIELRAKIQEINEIIAGGCQVRGSVIHYLLWNVFRNCCPRESTMTHCYSCSNCSLPTIYKELKIYEGKCLFSGFCKSIGLDQKTIDPPYVGHYY